MSYSDLMIDLETLGIEPNCVVVSIGAVFFDVDRQDFGPTYQARLDFNDQVSRGRIVNQDTLNWWLQQSPEAQKVFNEPGAEVKTTLQQFADWTRQHKIKPFVWGNGSIFDIVIMENLFSCYGIKVPWTFTKVMDLRTYKRFQGGNEKLLKSGVNHNALDDARSQAEYVLKFLTKGGAQNGA